MRSTHQMVSSRYGCRRRVWKVPSIMAGSIKGSLFYPVLMSALESGQYGVGKPSGLLSRCLLYLLRVSMLLKVMK